MAHHLRWCFLSWLCLLPIQRSPPPEVRPMHSNGTIATFMYHLRSVGPLASAVYDICDVDKLSGFQGLRTRTGTTNCYNTAASKHHSKACTGLQHLWHLHPVSTLKLTAAWIQFEARLQRHPILSAATKNVDCAIVHNCTRRSAWVWECFNQCPCVLGDIQHLNRAESFAATVDASKSDDVASSKGNNWQQKSQAE